MKRFLILVLVFASAVDAFAANKDFKGLFGSYRREKYTENEANSSDFGMDIMLSTMLPLSSVVKSQEAAGAAENNLSSAAFFDVEGELFYSFHYNWQLFADIGYFNYDSRRQNNPANTGGQELFHQASMTVFPILAGLKYRLSTSDIVPYIGIGAGPAFVTRTGSYDYSPLSGTQHDTAIAGEAIVGVEFYISSRMGIRVEASAFYMSLPEYFFTTNGAPQQLPNIDFQANPISMRYSSGLFILF